MIKMHVLSTCIRIEVVILVIAMGHSGPCTIMHTSKSMTKLFIQVTLFVKIRCSMAVHVLLQVSFLSTLVAPSCNGHKYLHSFLVSSFVNV